MSNEEPEIEIDFNADLEGMGYELAGSIEFYENPETGLGAFRSLLFSTTLESNLEEGEDYTTGKELVLVTQAMLEQYLDSEKH